MVMSAFRWWLFDDDTRHAEVEEQKVFAVQNEVRGVDKV
jgi:hypothetical protein